MRPTNLLASLICVLLLSGPGTALADGGGGGGGGSGGGNDPLQGYQTSKLTGPKRAIQEGDFAKAEKLLRQTLAEDTQNPDAWNLLGFAARKQGKTVDSEEHYMKALALDPEHYGALNYLGMLYIETGRLDQANEMLARLDDACFFPCKEYTSLKEAIATGKTN